MNFQLILTTFKTKDVREMRILFGANEEWVLKCPQISKNHYNENHRGSAESIVKNVLMKIVTNGEVLDYFSAKQLGITNVYLEFDMATLNADECIDFIEKDDDDEAGFLCNKMTIDLIHSAKSNVKCCSDLEISDGIESISISNSESKAEDNPDSSITTYKAKKIVKGYKELLTKGKTVWEMF